MKLLVVSSALLGVCSAFSPSMTASPRSATFLQSSEEETTTTIAADDETSPSYSAENPTAAVAINGWVPDSAKPCYGLPGTVAPTGYFDPIGFAQAGTSLNDIKRYREAEVQHGRVAMLATVGYLAGEAISGPFQIAGPANDQLAQMPLPAFAFLTVFIGAAELKRATIGWKEPDLGSWTDTLFTLRDSYYPGDLGFDPLGLKPTDAKEFAKMQTKELQNGRLAMLGAAGMCAQELVNHKTIMATVDFYQMVYSGVNPYDSL